MSLLPLQCPRSSTRQTSGVPALRCPMLPGRGGPLSSNKAGEGGSNRSDVLLEAQRARLEREEQRRLGQYSVKIQRMVRRALAQHRVLEELRVGFDHKVADIEKLGAWLESAQGVKHFAPPVDTTIRLARDFVLSYHPRRKGSAARVNRLCAVLLQRSLYHLEDPGRNVALVVAKNTNMHGYWWRKLVAILINSLRHIKHNELPRDGKAPPPIVSVLELLLQQLPPATALCRPLVAVPFFVTMRDICIRDCSTFQEPKKARRPIQPDPRFAPIFRLAGLVLTGPDPPHDVYLKLLLTLPLLVPLSGIDHVPFLPSFITIGRRLASSSSSSSHPLDACLPPSPCPSGPSSFWLTANLCTIFSTYVLKSTRQELIQAAMMKDEGLLGALVWLADLLAHMPPAFISDREVICLEQEGAYIKTLAVAQVVVEQVQSLVREDVARTLARLVVTGFHVTELEGGASAGELKEIETAHKVSTLQLTDETHKARQRQEARWIGARWASKLAEKLGSLAFGGGAGDDAAADEGEGDGDATREGGNAKGAGGSGGGGGDAMVMVVPVVALQSWCCLMATTLWKAYSASQYAAIAYGGSSSSSSATANNVSVRVLNTIAFSTDIVPRLWAHILSQVKVENSDSITPLDSSPTTQNSLHAALAVFCAAYAHMLMILDDSEIHEDGFPIPLHHVIRVIKFCKPIVLSGCRAEASGAMLMMPAKQGATTTTATGGGKGATTSSSSSSSMMSSQQQDVDFGAFMHRCVSRLLRSLYDRWSRRAFCSPDTWVIAGMEDWRLRRDIMNQTLLGITLLRVVPFCIPLPDRMVIFNAYITADRERNQPRDLPAVAVKIRRGALLHDAIHMLDRIGDRLKARFLIIYYSELGVQEQGIDAGGLFKDFWSDLSSMVFDLEFGLFMQTPDGLLYPNPATLDIHGPEHVRFFEFVGKILGKAMYENITVSPVFAHFFLGFIRGTYNFMQATNDLERLDPELYKNLIFLRTYEGDVADLGLSFTVVDQDLGRTTEVELIENGANVNVTNENKFRYIGLVAKHHMYDRLRVQSEAFVKGFCEIIDTSYLQMFNEAELQILISGSLSGIDVEDLRANTSYTGGYTAADWHVRRFWRVVTALSSNEQSALLRFVTGCPRPPPLGFRALQPPFTVHRVGISKDDKLPAASTCFNVLKLPTYSSEAIMRDKILVAIFAGSGFELS